MKLIAFGLSFSVLAPRLAAASAYAAEAAGKKPHLIYISKPETDNTNNKKSQEDNTAEVIN